MFKRNFQGAVLKQVGAELKQKNKNETSYSNYNQHLFSNR